MEFQSLVQCTKWILHLHAMTGCYVWSIRIQTHRCHHHQQFFSLLHKTNISHVVMHLFHNRSQKTSKCGKHISDTLGCTSCATFFFLPHFDVIRDLLLNGRIATWNLFVKYTRWWGNSRMNNFEGSVLWIPLGWRYHWVPVHAIGFSLPSLPPSTSPYVSSPFLPLGAPLDL